MALYRKSSPFDTVYFGGGTPSVLTPRQLERIISGIYTNFSILDGAEWTIEANPGDLNESYSHALLAMGFNRINIGVQSLDDRILSWLGRRHSRDDAISAFDNARAAGFGNVGLDCIYGIPGYDVTATLNQIRELASLAPEHLSCYQLTVEAGTPLHEEYSNGLVSMPTEDTECQYFMRISEMLTETGYTHYEVSNFAFGAQFRSRHNMKYWDHTPYLGLGPSAHSFKENRRWWNHRSVEKYFEDLKGSRLPIEDDEVLALNDLRLEVLSLGMRTRDGLSMSDFKRRFTNPPASIFTRIVTNFIQDGFLFIEADRIKPTLKGLAIADAMALEIDRLIDLN